MRNTNAIFVFLTSNGYYEWQADGCYNSSFTPHPFHLEETKNMSLFFILKSVCFSGHVDAAAPLHVGLDRADMAGAEVLQVTSSDCSVLLLHDFMLLHISPGSWSGSTSPTSWSTSASSPTPAPSDWRRSSIHIHDVLTILTYCPWFCSSLRTDFKILRGEQEKPFEILYLIC